MITIFNSKNPDYKKLSNNFKYDLNIYDKKTQQIKKYISATHFIYSNMLNSPVYAGSIQNREPKPRNVISNFRNYYQLTIDDIVQKCIDEALEERLKNPVFKEFLLATGTAIIRYESSNTLLGVRRQQGVADQGKNLYGIKLMQIRSMFREQKALQEKQEHNNALCRAYTAYKILEKAFRDGSSLEEYKNLGIDQIVGDEIIGSGLIDIINDDKNLRDMLELSIKYPKYLIYQVKTPEKLKELQTRREKEKKEIILNMYIDSILKKNVPELDTNKYFIARTQKIQKLTNEEFLNLLNKVYNLYLENKLSLEVTEQIVSKVSKIYIPSEREIEKVKVIKLKIPKLSLTKKVTQKVEANVEGDVETEVGIKNDEHERRAKIYLNNLDRIKKSIVVVLKQGLEVNDNEINIKKLNYDLNKIQGEILESGKITLSDFEKYNKAFDSWVESSEKMQDILDKKEIINKMNLTDDEIDKYIEDNDVVRNDNGLVILNINDFRNYKTDDEVFKNDVKQKEKLKNIELVELQNKIVPELIKKSKNFISINDEIFNPPEEVVQEMYYINSNDYNNIFSLNYSELFKIRMKNYPTISHFIYMALIKNTNKEYTIDEVYDKFIIRDLNKPQNLDNFHNIGDIHNEYQNVERFYYDFWIKQYARIALDKKFENEDFKFDLLSTENSQIVWNDPEDLILGYDMKNRNGQNYVGLYLMELRNKFVNEYRERRINIAEIKVEDFTFLLRNGFIKNFTELQVSNIFRMLVIFKRRKPGNSLEQVFDYVFKNVFNKCDCIFSSSDTNVEIPEQFYDIVYDQIKALSTNDFQDDISEKIIEAIWRYILSMLYIIINHISNKNLDTTIYEIVKVIKTVQDIQALRKPIVEQILLNSSEINIIVNSILKIVKNVSNTKIIQKSDIELAVSVILGVDIKDIDPCDIIDIQEQKLIFDGEDENIYEDEQRINEEEDEQQEDEDDNPDEKDHDYLDDDDMEGTFAGFNPDKVVNDDEEENNKRKRKPIPLVIENEDEEEEVDEKSKSKKSKKDGLNIENLNYDKFSAELLANYMKAQDSFNGNDCDDIAVYILKCASIVKNYKLYNYIKKNRLNFFA